jgi:trimeric autotransporter adhesin
LNTAVRTALSITDGAGTKKLTTIDAGASTGAITYADSETTVANITTGSGNDTVTIVTVTAKDNTATAADETITANVSTGAGNDTITVNVTGDGVTNVDAGDGNDTVHIAGRGTGKLNINLGAGSDTFTSAVDIESTDVIDAGEGIDTLLLSLVGSANVGAFRNFDVYDVKGMTANLDLDILNVSNTVTEIVASGALAGAVTLQNVAAGVNFRATKDMDANALSLTQKTAGALTVTLDADQAAEAAGDDVADMSVVATNATSVTAVFDAAYKNVAGSQAGETAATDNVSTITLSTAAATTVSVVSGGTNAQNVLNLTDTAAAGKLASVTVTGAQSLNIASFTAATNALANIDASAHTGGLTVSLALLKNGGNLTLGSGTDLVTVTNASSATGAESITAFEKTAAVSVSVAAGDAVAKAAAIAAADKLILAGATVADANGLVTDATISNGKLTFTGAGPATLEAAIAIADAFAETAGETALFEYLGNSYVFVQGATDTLVKLVGITGVTHFVEGTTADQFFIV